MRKGLLDFFVIRLLGPGEKYGYQLVQELKKMPNLIITEGTIYPILAKLKKRRLPACGAQRHRLGPDSPLLSAHEIRREDGSRHGPILAGAD